MCLYVPQRKTAPYTEAELVDAEWTANGQYFPAIVLSVTPAPELHAYLYKVRYRQDGETAELCHNQLWLPDDNDEAERAGLNREWVKRYSPNGYDVVAESS